MAISKNSGPHRPKICSEGVEMDSSNAIKKTALTRWQVESENQ